MGKFFEEVANDISEKSKDWIRQYAHIDSKEIERRRKIARGIKEFVRTLAGLFIRPKLGETKSIYIFEGLRNKEYMSVFKPDSVIIVGSHLERDYAIAHGYGFSWSFPMVGAVHSKIYREWSFPLTRQIKFWANEVAHFDRVIFFLYEDTQPLGIFFVHLARIFKSKVKSVCMQHGYFCILNYQLRCDGALSDINFVWDQKQAEVIGSERSTTFVIGLPYVARAMATTEVIVVLVGTGMADDGGDEYDKSLCVFGDIYDAMSQSFGVKVFYRPHPNEWANGYLIAELRKKFLLLDDLDKVQRLNGLRAIFVGTISSLLYEAGLAGHVVAHLKLHENIRPVFDFDFDFGSTDIDELSTWIVNIRDTQWLDFPQQQAGRPEPLVRFVNALHSANLISNNELILQNFSSRHEA